MKKYYFNFFRILALIFLSQTVNSQTQLTDSEFDTQIKSYLEKVKFQFGLTENDFSDLAISKQYYSSKTKITHVYLIQKYQNIEVFNSESSLAIKDNNVFYYANRLEPKISSRINTITPNINAKSAIEKAALHFDLEPPNNLEIIQNNNSNNEYIYTNGNISQENIPVKLVFLIKDDQLKLSWDLSIHTKDGKHMWSVRIDAVSGEILEFNDWILNCHFEANIEYKNKKIDNNIEKELSFSIVKNTVFAADGSQYNVFALPTESPNHGYRQLLIEPSNDLASPYGWHDTDGISGAEYTITRGNNVWAQEDQDGNDGTGYSPDGTGSLNFDFSLDLLQTPSGYEDVAITNLFYMNNVMHDIWYQYGFDEASGNFQSNNYGNGGLENDFVFADAQDGSGTNNATFGTPADGSSPSMTMFLWTVGLSNSLTINGGTLSGTYLVSTASFGEKLTSTPITADVVLLIDDDAGTSTDPNDACDTVLNGASLLGKIAILRRGDCEFGVKVLAAENAGAIAVIVVNNVSGNPVFMGPGVVGGSVTIPSVMVNQTDGEAIITALNNAETINVSLIEDFTIFRDGDFDNGIIAHEYGHGISNRLTGGASNANCLVNAEQMGEGWSDWFGLMLTMNPSDIATDIRGIGTFPSGQSTNGNGIRPAPYSTDFGTNDFTYGDTNNLLAISQPHGIGFVWATMLWDLTWAYIDKYGFDADLYSGTGGNNKVMQIVIDGLKMQPCVPGFIDGRDALLAADAATGGLDQCLIWGVFANRGLGFAASQGSSFSRTDQTEDFSMPDPDDVSLANCTTLNVEEFSFNEYDIYPNPTNDKLYIKTNKNFGEVTISLIDINGRQVFSKKINLFGEVVIDINKLQSGIYILNVNGIELNRNDKIIKR